MRNNLGPLAEGRTNSQTQARPRDGSRLDGDMGRVNKMPFVAVDMTLILPSCEVA